MCVVLSTVLLTGCSVDEIQSNGFFTGNSTLKQDLSANWFGRSSDDSKDGNSAYGNNRDYITFNYDINDVEDSKLEKLPEYDFSGPDATGSASASSNNDSSLTGGNAIGDTESTESKNASISGNTIYIAPLYCGLAGTGYLCRTYTAYTNVKSKSGKSNFTITDYRAAMKALKSPSASDGFGQNRFKGKSFSETINGNQRNFAEWKQSWNACYRIGSQLKADGCDVIYPYSVNKYTAANSDPATFFGADSSKDILSIARDIASKKPDYVIWVGFNEVAFGNSSSKTMTKNTLFAYENYGKARSNSKLAKNFYKSYNKVDDLAKALPADKQLKIPKLNYDKASLLGLQKAQTAITQLQIAGYTGKSVVLLLGNFNTSIKDVKSKYRYGEEITLYTQIAHVFETAIK